MSSPIDQLLAIIGQTQPQQASGNMGLPGGFGNPELQNQTPQPAEDSIVSPNPAQPNPEQVRMEGYRRLLTNFTYSLGSGLEAANANPRGRGQRTQAGMGAILQVPQKIQDARQAYALQQAKMAQELAAAKASEANAAKTTAGLNLIPAQLQQILAKTGNIQGQTAQLPALTQAKTDTAGATVMNAETNRARLEYQKTQKTAEQLKAEQYKYVTTQNTDEGPKALFQPPGWDGDPSKLVEKVMGGPLDKLSPAVIEDPNDSKRGLKADFNPRTGEYSVNGQVIPNAHEFTKPTGGAGSGYQLIKTVDENGDSVQMFVPKTPGTVYSSDYTAQEKNRRGQADIIQVEADRIIKMIDANPSSVGPLAGRIARGEAVIGNIDPQTKAIGTALGSFEALQPILHGFRGGSQTVDHFHSVIGDQAMNAEALKASLLQVKQLAADIKMGTAVDLFPAVTNTQAATDKMKTVPAGQERIKVIGPNGERGTILKSETLPPGWKAAP